MTTKKEKLTKVQQRVMDTIKNNAQYLYSMANGRAIDEYFENGEKPGYEYKNNCYYQTERAYITNENTVKVQAKKETLEVLVRKGYIKAVEFTNSGWDYVTLFEPTYEAPHSELTEITFQYGHTAYGKLMTNTDKLYCPIGQEQQTIDAYKSRIKHEEILNSFEIISISTIPCRYWK